MTRPKLLILGHGRHGKDTVAEMLRDLYGFSFISSSYLAAAKVMMPYFASIGSGYPTVNECYADRHNHRATWHEQIAAYNNPKDRLASEILAEYDMYVGMRSNEEYHASNHLFDYTVWVDGSRRGLEPEGRDSFNIDQTEEMWVIHNDTDLVGLRRRVDDLVQYIELTSNFQLTSSLAA